jgi:hypothetical protein
LAAQSGRIGMRMGSVALQGEGQQNFLCSYLAARSWSA